MQEIILNENHASQEWLQQIDQFRSIEKQIRLAGRPDLIVRLDQIAAMTSQDEQFAALEEVIIAFTHL